MSSKKDLLERLAKQTSGAARRRPADELPGAGPKETETRVADGVIRRRTKKQRKPGAPEPRSLPPAAATPPPAADDGARRVVTRRRPGREEDAPSPGLPSLATPPAPVPAEPPVAAVVTPVVEPARTVEAPPAVEPPVKPAPPAPEPVVEAPRSEPPPPAAAPPVVVAPSAVEPRAQAPAAPAEPTSVEARPEPRPVVEAPRDADDEARARRQAGPRLPGLGKAVVRPPPDYDPNDPTGNRRRAREAAQASTAASPNQGRSPSPPRWPEEGGEDAGRSRGGARGGGPKGPPAAAPVSPAAPAAGAAARRGKRRRGRVEAFMESDVPAPARRRRTKKAVGIAKPSSPKPKAQKRKVMVDNTVSVRQLAQEMSVQAGAVLKVLMGLGVVANINEQLDFDTAQMVANEFDYEVVNVGFQEEDHLISLETEGEDEAAVPRPPVVTVMGHVDHGKTTLLDAIRSADVAAGEAGGITQHIGAYQVKRGDNLVTFIDTPGHAAFTEMRARGAQATDVVILVVAADDGVMPQTIESINHTKAAGVPIVVAVNKCDKPGVKPERIRSELMEYGLVPEEYGGDTFMVNVSALKAQGIDALLDAVLLVAELQDLRANPDRHAEGVVLEAKIERGRGSVATMLVKKGTLKKGDPLVLGSTWGKVRAMQDHRGKPVKKAGPSMPVEVIGLDSIPEPGTAFVVAPSEKDARTLAGHRAEEERQQQLTTRGKVTLQDLLKSQQTEAVKKLNLIVKGDVQGSIEAIRGALTRVKVEGTEVSVLHSAVGAVSESDITLASTYGGIVIGFNVRPDAKARRMAEEKEVEVRMYRVIYDILDDVEKALKGMLEPERVERVQGHAEVRATFNIPKIGTIAGCFVTDGKIARPHTVRLLRQGVVVWEGRFGSLKRFKDDVREVEKGYECGLSLDGFQDLKVGDELETYIVELVTAS